MEASVVTGVEIGVEMSLQTERHNPQHLQVRLLGPLTVARVGVPSALPPSRKVRALLAYLVATRRPVTRSHLLELLWDQPSDPRGELRWCLSRLRTVLDAPDRVRVVTDGDTVAVDLEDSEVDVRAIAEALQQGLGSLPADRLAALDSLFGQGDFLEGLELPRSPAFTGWLVAERRRWRAAQATVLEHWVRLLPPGSDEALHALDRWLAIAPFDRRAHAELLDALAALGRLREAEEHLAATSRLFEAEGQDWGPIAHAWRAAKNRERSDFSAAAPLILLEPAALTGASAPAATETRRASLAVMPLLERTPGAALRGGLGDGMAHDLITRLSKLRSMFVIAEGTMFALSEKHVDPQEAGRRLDVDYVASGSLRRGAQGQLWVSVQLSETRTAQVVWAEEFTGRLDDTFTVLDEIGNHIVSSIADQIERAERNRAVLKNPNSLNAWEAHHRGLWHMVRFNREDNDQARHFFQAAVRLDPTFSRPHAGLSFTHFQDAFLGWSDARAAAERAYAAAAEALMADERDPAAHWAFGRALWLQSRKEAAICELQQAIDLSPNYAMGHYTLAWFQSQAGDAEAAIVGADNARALSPMDPLLFGMLASRALALLRLGRHDEAALWGVRSAGRPNAHVHIQAVAMFCLAMAGRIDDAKTYAAAIRKSHPRYGIDDFLTAFRLGQDAERLVRHAARLVER